MTVQLTPEGQKQLLARLLRVGVDPSDWRVIADALGSPPDVLRDEEMTAEEALREALGYALMLAKVHGSPVHEHLGDLLRAVVPDTIRALPDGWSLVGPDAGAMRRALGNGQVVVSEERLKSAIVSILYALSGRYRGIEREASSIADDVFLRLLAVPQIALPGPDATGGA